MNRPLVPVGWFSSTPAATAKPAASSRSTAARRLIRENVLLIEPLPQESNCASGPAYQEPGREGTARDHDITRRTGFRRARPDYLAINQELKTDGNA